MPRKPREIEIKAQTLTEFLMEFYGRIQDKKLAENPETESATTRELYKFVRIEYRNGKLKSRVRRFLNQNPMLTLSLDVEDEKGHSNGPRVAGMILHEMGLELIETVIGHHHIPRGIEEGDMWLAPATELQRMFQDRHGEDAVVIVTAKLEDGKLEPAFAWTDNEEVIAEAQKGHRRYMELLSKENRSSR